MEQWPQVKEIFHAALEREPQERAAFLAAACRGDAAIRAEVERLLAAHMQAASFMKSQPAPGGVDGPAGNGSRHTLSGQVVGHYEIGRLVGAGGMGEVYVARDVQLGRDVAVKVATGGDADAHARLQREARHASQLNHPNICTIHEVGSHDGLPFIVMEYVAGDRLSDRIPQNGLPIDTLLRYALQIADAVAHAHRQGVIHRDLKSQNICVTPDGRPKILDFGLARRFSGESLKQLSESRALMASGAGEGDIAGTLSCMAPELLRGAPATERSDVWAVGVLLFEMATGRRPFEGETGFELSGAILHAPLPPLPAKVPVPLQGIIRRCLAKEPGERYANGGEIRSALEAVQVQAEPIPGQVFRWRAAAMGAGLVAILAVAAGWYWVHRPRPAQSVAVPASGRPAIAVMTFETVGAPDKDGAWLSSGVPSMLLTGLAQTRGLDIVSTERLSDALKRRGGTSLASLDRSQAAGLARQIGAGTVVFGSIFRAGPEIRIDAQLEDLASGRVLVAQSVRGTDVFALVDELAGHLRNGIGFGDAQGVRPVADVSTSSLEAYRLYSLGVDAYRNSRMTEAEKDLQGAIALDPGFAEAYQTLAQVMGFRQLQRRRMEYLLKAGEHADRLSERRRLLLNVQLTQNTENVTEAARVLDELLTRYPDVEQAYVNAFQIYTPRPGRPGNLQKLLQIFSAGSTALPTAPGFHNMYGYVLAAAHRYPEAIGEFNTYVRLSPREANPYDSLGEGYLLAGIADKAVDAYSRALAIDPTFEGGRDGRGYSLAVLGRYGEALAGDFLAPSMKAFLLSRVGRHREAAGLIAGAVQKAVRDEDVAEHGWLLLLSSELAIERKEYQRALGDVQSAVRIVSSLPQAQRDAAARLANLLSGVAEIGAGRIDRARDDLAAEGQLGEPTGDVEKWWHEALAGEVALASGDLQGALAALSAGEPSVRMWFEMHRGTPSVLANALISRDGLARVAKARGDLRGAIQTYRRLLVYGPEQKWVAPFEPRYVHEIARLLDQTGDKEAAKQEYARFLQLWKGADPGLPELAEARTALQKQK